MKTTNKFLALALMAVAMVFASCSKDDNDPVGPTQQEIETKIIGKWKSVTEYNKETLTNNRFIETYSISGKGYTSYCNRHPVTKELGWINKQAFTYTISGNYVITKDDMDKMPNDGPMGDSTMPESFEKKQEILSIDENSMLVSRVNGEQINLQKVTADYSNDIIGLWEGVEMTGYETYGNIEARIEYKADGTYTYYKKVDGEWQPLEDVFDEWNVDGDWLATRWQNNGSDVMNYEWWDIDYIKKEGDDTIMKWSALREKEDGTRFNTTFTWKKVK